MYVSMYIMLLTKTKHATLGKWKSLEKICLHSYILKMKTLTELYPSLLSLMSQLSFFIALFDN